MFGDNLSVISDTTIAATRGAGCEMKDKFRMNFKIALPAAVTTPPSSTASSAAAQKSPALMSTSCSRSSPTWSSWSAPWRA